MSDFVTRPPTRRFIYMRDLLRELVVRDMKVRYKRSVLGVAWSLLNPLAQLLVFFFIFGLVLPLKYEEKDQNPHTRLQLTRRIALKSDGDNALYVRVTQEDGHLIWSSPIYIFR